MSFRASLVVVLCINLGCDSLGYQEQQASSARAVFVLAHGLGANAELGFSADISDALTTDGFAVYKTEVPVFDSVEVRAMALATQVDSILTSTKVEQVHIIGHSMGGLDARYLIATLGYGDVVASLTTVATPHRGSPLADYVLEDDGSGGDLLSRFGGIFGDDEATRAQTRAAVRDLSEAQSVAFNSANPDVDGVRYLSWGGFATALGMANDDGALACAAKGASVPNPDSLGLQFVATASVVAKGQERVAHDGLVPVESARWGEFFGCVAADHFDEVGLGLGGEFDAVALYRDIAAAAVP